MDLNEREFYMIQRKRKHLKLKQLAKHIGVSISMISQHELGKNTLSDEKYRHYKEFINTGGKIIG
jgi:transcriptional regulator with XRE-family HTH domain